MRMRLIIGAASLLALVGTAATSHAGVVLNFNYVVGDFIPAGSSPWIQATFTQEDDNVRLTLLNKFEDRDGFTTRVAFTYKGAPDSLSGFDIDIHPSDPGDTKNVTGGLGGSIPGMGDFDLYVQYQIPNKPKDGRFEATETSILLLAREGGSMLASNFGIKVNDDGHIAGAQVQGLTAGPGESTQLGATLVPEPSTLAIALIAGVPLGIVGLRRHRRRSQVEA